MLYKKTCLFNFPHLHAFFQSNPSIRIHYFHRSCHFLNTNARPYFSSSLHRASTALMTSWLQLNFRPLSRNLISGNSRKSHGVKCGLYGSRGTVLMPQTFKKSTFMLTTWDRALSWCSKMSLIFICGRFFIA